MSAPLVSVCVPARNAERFLGEALASALAQPVALELLVCDDGSCDGTRAIAEAVASDPRVRLLRHARPRGVVAARNALLAAARGRPASRSSTPTTRTCRARSWPAGGAAGARAGRGARPRRRPRSSTGRRTNRRRGADRSTRTSSRTGRTPSVSCCCRTRSSPRPSSPAVTRSQPPACFASVGPSSSDWDMWLRLALHGAVAYRAALVARYRQHDAIDLPHSDGVRCPPALRRPRHAPSTADLRPEWGRGSAVVERAGPPGPLGAGGESGAPRRRRATRGERRAALRALVLAARMRPDLVRAACAASPARIARATTTPRSARAAHCWTASPARSSARATATRSPRAPRRTPTGRRPCARIAHDRPSRHAARRGARHRHEVGPDVAGALPVAAGATSPTARRCPTATRPTAPPPSRTWSSARAGLSHLVFPSASFWWLDHYAGLAERLRAAGPPVHADDGVRRSSTCGAWAQGMSRRGRIAVAGSVAQKAHNAGHTWQFLQYLLGFRRLGYQVLLLDSLDSRRRGRQRAERERVGYVESVMREHGLDGAWTIALPGRPPRWDLSPARDALRTGRRSPPQRDGLLHRRGPARGGAPARLPRHRPGVRADVARPRPRRRVRRS